MADVDIYYINLARAEERRRAIEENFARAKFPSNWRLNRFEAVNIVAQEVQTRTGPIIPALKANWLSHLGCVETALQSGLSSHVLIAEDDTAFGDVTALWTNGIIELLPPNSWDVIYLDAFIPNALDMAWFYALRHKCFRESRIELLPLFNFNRAFAGAGAYLVNRARLEKFLALTNIAHLPCAFDLYLRQLAVNNALKGILAFPFLATVAETADVSQVQHTEDRLTQDVLLNAFRRLVWMGAGPPKTELAPGETVVTRDMAAFTKVFASLLTLQLEWAADAGQKTLAAAG